MTFKQYNITNITDAPGNVMVNIMQKTSEQVNYLPGTMILLAFFIVIFISLKMRGYSTVSCTAATSFANLILAILFYALGIIPGAWLALSALILPISIALLYFMEGSG